MRLIDADLFKERIMSGYYVYCQANKQDIIDAIDCEPTVPLPNKQMTKDEYEQNVGRLYTDEGYLGGDDQ